MGLALDKLDEEKEEEINSDEERRPNKHMDNKDSIGFYAVKTIPSYDELDMKYFSNSNQDGVFQEDELSATSIADLRVILFGIYNIYDEKILSDYLIRLPKQNPDNSYHAKIMKSFSLPKK